MWRQRPRRRTPARSRRALANAAGGRQQPAAVACAGGGTYGAPSVPPDQRFLYFNNRRVSRRGIGLGGSLRHFRLYIDATLEDGTSLTSCETFADGALASAEAFEIGVLEVWGCGGRGAVLAQEEWKEEQVEMRRRSVRRAVVGDDDVDETTGERRGVTGSNAGKEERWLLGLLGFFGGGAHGRDARQDAAYSR